MSSSNQIRLAYLAETTYGVTPGTGNFTTMRHSGESLSGTTQTEAPNEIRADRQPTGQKQVGLTLGGDVNGLLAPTSWVNDMIEAGMMDTYNAKITTGAATLTIGGTGTTITRAAGSYVTDGFAVGDIVQTAGFTTAANNTYVYVSAVTATVLTVVGPSGFTDEVGGGDETVVRHAYVEIGADNASFSIEKNFQDLTDKTISYRGMRVNTLDINAAYGGLSTFSVGFVGGGTTDAYEQPTTPMTDSRTVDAAETQDPLNGTTDLPLIVVEGALVDFCIQSMQLQVNNNCQARTCIGQLAPSNQTEMEANVNISFNAYTQDENFDFISKKINNTDVPIYWVVENSGEGFAFAMPAVNVSFPDPGATGKNQQSMINVAGTSKPTSTLNALRIYKVTAA